MICRTSERRNDDAMKNRCWYKKYFTFAPQPKRSSGFAQDPGVAIHPPRPSTSLRIGGVALRLRSG